MDFEAWEPYYERILKDFGFSRAEDERAAKVLDTRLDGTRIDPEELALVLSGQAVSVAGNAPPLGKGFDRLTKVVVAADEGASTPLPEGPLPGINPTEHAWES